MAKKNLLLVDSDAKALRMLEVSLRKAGFSVTTAISSADAVGKIRLAAPDLILTETRLPDESGLSFVGRLKAQSETAHIPIVFLSSENLIDQKVRGLELGVEDYLTKPIYLKEVLTRIRILLEKLERETLERRERSATFAGLLGEMGLVDLIQTIEMGRKTGRIFLDNPPHKGAVAFRDGKVVDARTGRLKGERAFYRMLVWNEGVFQMEFGPHEEQDVIELSTQGLLMEGMRRVDEWGRLLEQLPPLEHAFEIDYTELVNRLSEIPDEVNGVLRLFDGRRSLLDVVDESDFGDLEALEVVSKLYFEGLIYDVGDRDDKTPAVAPAAPVVGVERIERWLDTGIEEPAPAASSSTSAPSAAALDAFPATSFTLAPPKGETTPPSSRDAETGPPSYLTDSMPPVSADDWDDVVASDEVISSSERAPSASATPRPAGASHDGASSVLGDALAEELGLSPDEVALAVADDAPSTPTVNMLTPLDPGADESLARAIDDAMPARDTDVEDAPRAILASELGRQKGTPDAAVVDDAPSAVTPSPAAGLVGSRSFEVDTMPERPALRSDASIDEPLPPPSAALPAIADSTSSPPAASAPHMKAAPVSAATDDLDETDRAFQARAAAAEEFEASAHLDDDDYDPSRRSPFGTAALFVLLLGLGFVGAVGVSRMLRDDGGEAGTNTSGSVVDPREDGAEFAARTDGGTERAAAASTNDGGEARSTGSDIGLPPSGDAPAPKDAPTEKPALALGETKPGETKPGEVKPGETKPGETKPGDPRTSDNKPTANKPVDEKRPDREPGTRNPVNDDDARPSSTSSDDAFASHLKKATGFAQKGEHSKSIRSFKAALALKGDSAAAHLGLGNAYYELNSIDAALVHLERAKALAPDDAQVYVLLGAVYQSAGRTKDAIRAYQRYLSLAPNGRFARELKNVLQGLEAQP
jgi:CheY-like chemotaxis protein/tetratricopeptide (TPR) repeat protein